MHYHPRVPATRSVLLRHDLPDGTWHIDWLIDPVGSGGSDERNLIAFRLSQRPDEGGRHFDAVRLPDHRRMYLDFEGCLSGERGRVERVKEWVCILIARAEALLLVRLESPRGEALVQGVPAPRPPGAERAEIWRFERLNPSAT